MSVSRPIATTITHTSTIFKERDEEKPTDPIALARGIPKNSKSLEGDRVKNKGLVFEVLATPYSQLQEKHRAGKTSRIELLKEAAKKYRFDFAAVPIQPQYGTIGKIGILDPRQTNLKLDIARALSSFAETFDHEEAQSANRMLTSGVKGQHYLSALKTPAMISIEPIEKKNGEVWPEDASANMSNVLLMAGKFMSDVVFFDPKKLDGQNYLLQSMTLTCEFHRFDSLVQQPLMKIPLWLTSDESHIYIFQDNTRPSKAFVEHYEAIFGLIEHGVKPAFSDIVGHGQSITSSVAIKQTEDDSLLRLIPTLSGITIQAIQKEDILYTQPKYLLFLYSIARQLCDNASQTDFNVERTSGSILGDSLESTEFLSGTHLGRKLTNEQARKIMLSEPRDMVFSTSGAHSSRHLVSSVETLKKNYGQWLKMAGEVKRFAIYQELKEDQTKREIDIKFKQIQDQFKSEKDGCIKNAMEVILTDIPYSKYLRSRQNIYQLVDKWVKELQNLTAKSVSATSTLPEEMTRNHSFIMEALSNKSCVEIMQQKHINMVNACILDITTLLDIKNFTGLDKSNILVPLLTQIMKLQISSVNEKAEPTELYELVIEGLAQADSKDHKPWVRPKNISEIGKWLTDNGKLGCFTLEQQNVFLLNHEAIFNILGKRPQDINKCMQNNLRLVKKNQSGQYGTKEIMHFEATLKDWAKEVRHKKIVDKETRERFMNFIPAIQELMLGRLWLTSDGMNNSLATSFNLLGAPDAERSIANGATLPTSAELVISKQNLQDLKSTLKVKIELDGKLVIRSGNSGVKLYPQRLMRLNGSSISRPAMLVVKDCLTQNSHEFDGTWGKESPAEKKLDRVTVSRMGDSATQTLSTKRWSETKSGAKRS